MNSIIFDNLKPNTTYYWVLKGKAYLNGIDIQDYTSDVYSFTTTDDAGELLSNFVKSITVKADFFNHYCACQIDASESNDLNLTEKNVVFSTSQDFSSLVDNQLLNFSTEYYYRLNLNNSSITHSGQTLTFQNIKYTPKNNIIRTPDLKGTQNSKTNPASIADVIDYFESFSASIPELWIKGYIVGYLYLGDPPQFSAEGFSDTMEYLLIADSPDEKSATKCVVARGWIGDIYSQLSLKRHPDNLGKQVILKLKGISHPNQYAGSGETYEYKWPD